MFRVLFVLTQSPGLNWYRCASFAKHMDIETAFWPRYSPDKAPNWQEVLVKRGIAGNKILYELEKEVVQADRIVVQRTSYLEGIATIMGLKAKHGKKVLVEIDDDAFNVDSSNPAYSMVNPNSDAEKSFRIQLKAADAVIVSTENLKKIYKPENKKIYVVKNGVDFGIWDRLKKPKKRNKKIRIAWQGGWHHFEDLNILSGVIPKIAKKYDVEFHFFGFMPDYLKACGIFHEMVAVNKYPRMMTDLNPDIILAPLHDNLFNRSKSNLRVLEAGAMKKAIIASSNKNLPYAQTLTDGKDGLLVNSTEEWVSAIGLLIEYPNLREELGNNLYRKVKTDYNIKDIAKEYQGILRKI